MIDFRKMVFFACIITFSVFIYGCFSSPMGYGKSYKSSSEKTYAETKEVEVIDYSEFTLIDLKKKGYVVIGESRFTGLVHLPSQAIAQAKKVGADVLLFYYRETGTVFVNGAYLSRGDHYVVFLKKPSPFPPPGDSNPK